MQEISLAFTYNPVLSSLFDPLYIMQNALLVALVPYQSQKYSSQVSIAIRHVSTVVVYLLHQMLQQPKLIWLVSRI